jgi:hypothetical protein
MLLDMLAFLIYKLLVWMFCENVVMLADDYFFVCVFVVPYKSTTVYKMRGFYFNLAKGEILQNTWIFISQKKILITKFDKHG